MTRDASFATEQRIRQVYEIGSGKKPYPHQVHPLEGDQQLILLKTSKNHQMLGRDSFRDFRMALGLITWIAALAFFFPVANGSAGGRRSQSAECHPAWIAEAVPALLCPTNGQDLRAGQFGLLADETEFLGFVCRLFALGMFWSVPFVPDRSSDEVKSLASAWWS